MRKQKLLNFFFIDRFMVGMEMDAYRSFHDSACIISILHLRWKIPSDYPIETLIEIRIVFTNNPVSDTHK